MVFHALLLYFFRLKYHSIGIGKVRWESRSAVLVTVGQVCHHTPKNTTEVCRALAEAGECTAFEKLRVPCRMAERHLLKKKTNTIPCRWIRSIRDALLRINSTSAY